MWKQHIAICTTLALLAIPLYIADRYLTKGGGGGWISLDFSGVIIIPYIAFDAVHIAVSSLILAVSPNLRLLPLHLFSGILTIGLLVGGFLTYSARQRARDAANYEKRDEIIQQLRKAIELREWWYEPSDEAPKEIHVRIKVHESARVSGNADGKAGGNLGQMIFNTNTQDTPHHDAGKEEEFLLVFPLQFLKEGKADSVSITLYMFKGETGTIAEDATIIFEDKPSSPYDGLFIREQIPPRTPR
jgi:hypothetical protein